MKHWRISHFFLAGLCCAAMAAAPRSSAEISAELDSSYSYVGGTRTGLGGNRTGKVAEQNALARFVISPQVTEGFLLRIGADWQHYSFDIPTGVRIPNTLESRSLVLGADMQLFEGWLLRVEMEPGFYGDSNDSDPNSFNIPVIVGASYLVSPDLQLVLGFSLDANGLYPLLPGAGVRWNFASQWVLDAILPKPRLEYELDKTLTVYAGGEVKNGSYRVDDQFGNSHNDSKLNNAILDYTEIRVGAGAAWKPLRKVTVEAEVGCMPYREFYFQRAGVDFVSREDARYVQIAIIGRF